MAQRLVLWDIDGTLVRVGEVGAEIFDRAIERVVGLAPPSRVSMSGKTDPQIALEYLHMLEVADVHAQLAAVLTHLEAELEAAAERVRSEGRVLPGVLDVLGRLHDDPGVLQSVLTGNLAPNAAVKLGAFHLERWLDLEVGAYGSDHHDRTALVPIALDRAFKVRRRRFEPRQVWIVGDSPRDLACARAGGARCVLVCTGRFGRDELEPLGADAVLDDLGDVDRVVELLRS